MSPGATARSSGAARRTSSGPTISAPVAAFTAAFPCVWSGCQWVLRIMVTVQPASRAAASTASASGVSTAATSPVSTSRTRKP